MTVFDLLSRLRRQGVTLWVEEDKLRYSAAKGSLTLALREQIAERKAEIIESLRKFARTKASAAPPIRRVSREQPLPLSFAQQRLWFLDQLVPGSTFYNISLSMPLHFPINVGTLERSLNELVRRHESLRTTFAMQDGGPLQLIAPSLMIPLTVEDLTGLPPEQREPETQRLTDQEARSAFDLACGPLLRTTLLKLGAADFKLLLCMHHIVSDGWSMGIFLKELAELYAAFSMGRLSPLPALPIQYPDFAVWQREWLQGEVLDQQLAYWKQQLSDLPVLLLPTDRPRPNIQTFYGGYYPVRLPSELTRGLKALSQQEGVTLFMTLLAAFQAMLHHYTRQEDIVVGAPIAGRNRREIESLIGFFVNSLVLRTDLSGDPTVRELLGRVREVTLGAYGHQDLPFEMLVEKLQPERDLSRNPLFQVTFQLFNAPTVEQPTVESSELAREVRRGTAIFDVVFILTETREGLVGGLEYDSDLFDASTIERMAAHFNTLLEGIVANPDQHLSELPLLTNAEQIRILRDWNDTSVAFTQDVCLHHLFDAQVERSPAAMAVVSGSEQITYRELNRRANQLAHYLRSFDVGPDTLVGICATQSIEMVVGLLGVLKAGGAYVPLDPAYPPERLRFMIEDAKVSVLLTQTAIAEYLPKNAAKVINLDHKVAEFASDLTLRSEAVGPQNIAYMLYTSGSTGRPRGVMVSHGAICNHMLWMQQAFPLTASDRVIQRTAFSFDASVWEFYAPLLAGAQLIMPEPRPHVDIPNLIKTIVVHQITVLQLVPSLLQMLLDEPAFYTCSSLRRVFCGGEALSIDLQKRFFNRSDAELCNLYGPTEACIDAIFMRCERDGNRQVVPIGRPVANTQAYVLDPEMRPVPVGVAGELYIGGRGLARGYFNRADFTAEKFVPNPFSEDGGSRLYRTGDLVRYRADANLDFLGRIDHQVKVRGYRIELGEIENVLAQNSSVKEAVVLSREDVHDDKRLTAYVVQNFDVAAEESGAQLSEEQVAQWQKVYEDIVYRDLDTSTVPEPTQNFIGWNSSYTGQPIALAEMRDWLNHTVERIMSLRPRRVLEIGCGSGLVLFRIAPQCLEYWATDFSSMAINHLRKQLDQMHNQLPPTHALQRRADDFTGFEAQTFDTVILNSVVQYFPRIDYLIRVLEGAVEAVRDGGSIFIGDVRSLPLLEAFHTSVELSHSSPSLSTEQLQQQIQKRLAEEQELVIDPAFFVALKQHLPRISHVSIQPKRGRFANELTRFRYDVTLHIEREAAFAAEDYLDWRNDQLSIARLQQLLLDGDHERVLLRNVPNARVQAEITALELLISEMVPATVAALEKIMPSALNTAIDPEDMWALSNTLAYSFDLRWSGGNRDGSFQVICERRTTTEEQQSNGTSHLLLNEESPLKPWKSYANNPLQGLFTRKLVPELRSELQKQLPEYMVPTVFVLLDALPLTPNGKVDRNALPVPGADRPELKEEYVEPSTATEKLLADIWKQVLRVDRIGIHDNFFALGGDSILSIQIIARANQAGVQLTPSQFFQHQTIAELASSNSGAQVEAEQQTVTGPVPLTPIQHWFLEQELTDLHQFNQSVLLDLGPSVDPQAVTKCVQHLLLHHDALRLKYEQSLNGWSQYGVAPDENTPFTTVDLASLRESDQTEALEAKAAELKASLNLTEGSILRAALFQLGGDRNQLFLAIHPLVVDRSSWQILVEDLLTTYKQLSRGDTLELHNKTTSFSHWARRLTEYAQTEAFKKEADYWLAQQKMPAPHVPVDYTHDNNTADSARMVITSIGEEETLSLLQDVSAAYHTEVEDSLLTALAQAFGQWTRTPALLFDLKRPSRERLFDDVDLTRTVGCFNTIFPVHLELEGIDDPGTALKSVKEHLRRIPKGGIGHGILRYLTDDDEITKAFSDLPQAEISCNYLGQLGAHRPDLPLIDLSEETGSPSHGPRRTRRYLLEIDFLIKNGKLQMIWTYSENSHRRSTIEALAQTYIEKLNTLITHCKSPEAGGYTPSDFSKARLSQNDLDKLLSKINRSSQRRLDPDGNAAR
jgi:amino acid adenylation domain-containing protein/non-ribosomal peptide synthase protein (TIGR01720 family)